MHVLTERNSPLMNVHSGNPVVEEQAVYSNSFNLHASCWRNNHLYWTYTLELPRLNPQQLQLSLLGNPAMCFLGEVSLGRCLSWVMSLLGDVSWRRLTLGRRLTSATSRAVDLLTFLPWVPWGVPPCVDFDFWSTPGYGTVHLYR